MSHASAGGFERRIALCALAFAVLSVVDGACNADTRIKPDALVPEPVADFERGFAASAETAANEGSASGVLFDTGGVSQSNARVTSHAETSRNSLTEFRRRHGHHCWSPDARQLRTLSAL